MSAAIELAIAETLSGSDHLTRVWAHGGLAISSNANPEDGRRNP